MFRYALPLSCAISMVSGANIAAAAAVPQWYGQAGVDQQETAEETLTNEDVIKLVTAELPDTLIMQRIQSAVPNFDTSSDGLIALTTAGVPKQLIGAMMARAATYARSNGGAAPASATGGPRAPRITALATDSADPTIPHVPGIYMINASGFTGKMRRVEPVYADLEIGKGKGGGGGGGLLSLAKKGMSLGAMGALGSPFGGGGGGGVGGGVGGGMGDVMGAFGALRSLDSLFGSPGASGAARIRGNHASVRTNLRSPVFYIYFDESVPDHLRGSAPTIWADGGGSPVSTPEDLQLVAFTQQQGYREVRFGPKVKDFEQIHFSGELISPGIYRVTVRSYLKPGQYGIIQPIRTSDGRGDAAARVFDFEIH